jgi:2-polyprenyl-6-methoxyphenol hydroxylase-like FAD-dependent oxidoreductase
VTLALAREGHAVTALDRDPRLLDELARRAEDLPVRTALADARSFRLDQQFSLIIAPMQTIQLLGGADGRGSFLRRAAAHLRDRGLLAIALTEDFDLYSPETGAPPLPADTLRLTGTTYLSRPIAVREEGGKIVLERRREVLGAGGERETSDDLVRLDRLTTSQLQREARACGLLPAGLETIPETADHVGSVVVMLGG